MVIHCMYILHVLSNFPSKACVIGRAALCSAPSPPLTLFPLSKSSCTGSTVPAPNPLPPILFPAVTPALICHGCARVLPRFVRTYHAATAYDACAGGRVSCVAVFDFYVASGLALLRKTLEPRYSGVLPPLATLHPFVVF